MVIGNCRHLQDSKEHGQKEFAKFFNLNDLVFFSVAYRSLALLGGIGKAGYQMQHSVAYRRLICMFGAS